MIGQAAITQGALFAVAVYLMLSRNTQLVAMGFLVLSNAANMLVVTASGLPAGARPPIVDGTAAAVSDPLPQAFLLTAIVIGFGAAAFLLALAARAYAETATDELGAGGGGE